MTCNARVMCNDAPLPLLRPTVALIMRASCQSGHPDRYPQTGSTRLAVVGDHQLLGDVRATDVVELRELRLEIRSALVLQARLQRATTGRRALAVLGVKLVDDVHAANAADRREAHRIEARVVGEVDEELIDAAVATAGRERDHAARVALRDRVVVDALRAPRAVDLGLTVDADLRHEV